MNNIPAFGALNYGILFVYLAVMFAIGLRLAGKQKTTEDYFLAGRRMPWLIVALSMFASLTSAISFMGIPGLAYRENCAQLAMGFVSILAAPLLIFLYYPFYRKLNVTTSYEYISLRYGRYARFMVSGLFILARLGYLGVVIYAPALALSVVAGVNIWIAIIVMGILATAYTVLGGLSAVLFTDVVQFILLVGGAIWIAVTLLLNVPDGWSGIMTLAQETGHLRVFDWRISLFEMTGIGVAITCFFGLLNDYGADQVTVQRLLATKNLRGTAKAIILNSFIDLGVVGLLLFVGLGLFAYFHHFPERLAEGISGDRVMPYYIMRSLPLGVSGLVITAIFAAAMSSMDSVMNSLSTVIVNDFVRPLRRRPRTDQEDIRLARILTFGFGLFGVLAACLASRIGYMWKTVALFMSLFVGPVMAIFLMGVLTRRANFRGWLVGMIVAIPVTLWLQHGVKIHFIWYGFFCFGVNFIVGYLASAIFGGKKVPIEYTLWGRSKLKPVNRRPSDV